jgi:DNA polymerase III subunit epsilon
VKDFFNQFMRKVQGNNKEQEAWNRSILRESLEQERVLSRSWDQLIVSAIDSETTGFHPQSGDEMISLAAVKCKGDFVDAPFHTYIQIQGVIPSHITQLTGIDERSLVGAPPIDQALQAFFDYVTQTILVGFYIGHDIRFINHYLWKSSRSRLKHRTLEVKSVVDILYPACRDSSFDEICQLFEIFNPGRHTAVGDALAVAALWNKLTVELKQREIVNLTELYRQLALHQRQK